MIIKKITTTTTQQGEIGVKLSVFVRLLISKYHNA